MRHNILALTSDGTPHQWFNYEQAITAKVKGLIAWELGDPSVFRGGTSRMTGERSTVDVAPIIAIKGKFKFVNRIPALTNERLFRRDLHTCSYCGNHFNDLHLTRDHIIPTSKGGKDVWTNCTTACKKCNNKKGDQMLNEAGLQLLWVPYAPDRCEILILANRNILKDQAEFIASFLPAHSRVPQYLEQKCGIKLS